jgi:hypothetical protein
MAYKCPAVSWSSASMLQSPEAFVQPEFRAKKYVPHVHISTCVMVPARISTKFRGLQLSTMLFFNNAVICGSRRL